MPINEADATAIIYVEGLAISCFSPKENRGETAIMREIAHDLTLTIITIVNGTEVGEDQYNFSRTGASIEITGVGNADVDGFAKFEGVNFIRTTESINDVNDLRWIADLEGSEFHDSKLTPTGTSESQHNMPLTPLYIKNALFYGKANSDYTNNRIEKDTNGNVISTNLFGKYGYIMGAKIIADSINIKLTGSSTTEINLNAVTNTQFRIVITNNRASGDTISDFPEFYKVVYATNGINFDVKKVIETGSYFCSKVFNSRMKSISILS
jgi:hypothetical protein